MSKATSKPAWGYVKSEEGRFNPGPRSTCAKCSERDNLFFAYAYGKAIFLCKKHHLQWVAEAERNKDMVRQQPFKQLKPISGGEDPYKNQDRKVW